MQTSPMISTRRRFAVSWSPFRHRFYSCFIFISFQKPQLICMGCCKDEEIIIVDKKHSRENNAKVPFLPRPLSWGCKILVQARLPSLTPRLLTHSFPPSLLCSMRWPTSCGAIGQRPSCTRDSRGSLCSGRRSCGEFGHRPSCTRSSKATLCSGRRPTSCGGFGRRPSCTRNSKDCKKFSAFRDRGISSL